MMSNWLTQRSLKQILSSGPIPSPSAAQMRPIQHRAFNYNYTYIHTPAVYQVQVSTVPLLQAHIIHQKIVVQANSTSHIC